MKNETNIHNKTIINKAWNVSKGKFDFSFLFAFQNREQYLEFRRLWKLNYAALGMLIRTQKALIKSTMQHHEYAGELQRETLKLRAEATVQLSMLNEAKQEANRQFLAAKQTAK